MDIKKLRAAWHLNEIKRFHMVNTKTTQDVAQHSFRVAFISKHIAQIARERGMLGIDPNHAFYFGACHDMDEMTTGDIPSHVKIALRSAGVDIASLAEKDGFKEVNGSYKWIVKAADLIESVYWCEVNIDPLDTRAASVKDFISKAFDNFMIYLMTLEGPGSPVAYVAVAQARDDIEHITHTWCQNYDLEWPSDERS